MRLYDPCPRCNGSGVIPHPAWDEWWARNQARKPSERDPLPDEPEVVDCDQCDGTGMHPTEDGLAILDFLRRYRRAWGERRGSHGHRRD